MLTTNSLPWSEIQLIESDPHERMNIPGMPIFADFPNHRTAADKRKPFMNASYETFDDLARDGLAVQLGRIYF